MAEVPKDNDQTEIVGNCQVAYKTASDMAKKHLDPTNPILLSLALNFSILYYEILDSPSQACLLAKKVLDKALSNLNKFEEGSVFL